jgi:serine/threonine-protein kinase
VSPGQIDASESICAGVLLAGRYSILREIGHGGMGRVLAAYDHQLARKVAIKVLLNDGALTSPSTSANERLLREARALARLNHPNVVAIYDVTNVGRNLILAMEYIEGPTLKQWLNDKSLSLSQRLDRIAEAGEGLHAAHEAGLIHRDFKPDNVLIDCDGHARVLDFGLVGVVEPTRSKNSRATESPTLTSWQGSKSERTNPGDVLGTPLYMAPEQHLGQPTDARTDCYAFCEVLFLAVYGIHPFENVRSDPEALVQAKLAATFAPVPHRKARQRIPGIDELLNRGLAADPDLRYATMRDVLNDLAGLRQNDLESRHSLALTAIGTLLACLLLLVGVPMARTDSPSICTNREALLQAAWNDDLANRLRLRITRASTNESERLWQHLKSSIDDFAGQWQVHYDETCESNRDQTPARSSRPQAEEIRRCLNEDLDHLRGVLHALIESPSSTPRNVLRAIEGLPTPKSCADEAGSRSEGILPRDPIARKEALERRQNLARVIGEHVVHRRVETLNKLDEIIAAGSASGDEALLSLVFSHYGKILYQESRYEEADRYYSKCILYGLAFRDHFSSAYAATFLIYLRGFILGQAAGAQEAKELAASLFAAAPHQTMVEADYHHHVGLLAYVRGDLDQSILEIEKAFAAVARDFGPRSFFSVPALIDLGAIRLDRGAYAESAAASQEAIDILESMQGPESERISLAYCNLAPNG